LRFDTLSSAIFSVRRKEPVNIGDLSVSVELCKIRARACFEFSVRRVTGVLTAIIFLPALAARADMIELTNGDHYRGTVISMTASNVEFLSEIQGRVILPRAKVAEITLHQATPKRASGTNQMAAAPLAGAPLILSGSQSAPAAPADPIIAQMQQKEVDPKLLQQVQEQIFGKASPEAAQQFNQTMNGLVSGSLTVQDIRRQAQDSIAQIKAAKAELGPEAGETLDGYLAILQKFVQEAASDNTVSVPVQTPAAPAASVTVGAGN